MALDKILIGARIREIREEVFEESREKFSQRCNLTERHIGQIERGDFLLSLTTLDMIVSSTGIDINYILYGNNKNEKLNMMDNFEGLVNTTDTEELKAYYKCISIMKNYINKKCNNH